MLFMSPMIPMMMIKFTAYKILMVSGLFKFFEFGVLRFEFCGGFVAIGRRRGSNLIYKKVCSHMCKNNIGKTM